MIAVIADDLTGAAELAGAAHALGLSAEVQTAWHPSADADVIALDSNTRSLPAVEAEAKVRADASAIRSSQPGWIYKKTDSVLRGHARQEIESILDACELSEALLVPANPSKGRIIRHGVYSIHSVPLDKTDFAHDPDHPRRSARVTELLGDSPRIQIPDTASVDDVKHHAATVQPDTLPAGGVDFFEALLKARAKCLPRPAPERHSPEGTRMLFLCGSATAWGRGREARFLKAGLPLLTLGESAFTNDWTDDDAMDLASRVVQLVNRHARVAVAIGGRRASLPGPPSMLARRLCEAASLALRGCRVDAVCVEGGATAAALLQAMHCVRLKVIHQLAGGVVELRPVSQDIPSLILKVGSYDWPESVLPG